MHYLQLNEPSIVFQCSEEEVYFGDVRPTAYSPGVLIEISKKDVMWHGVYLVYHYSSSSRTPPSREMVSSKISFKEQEFPDLILRMRHVFSEVPDDVAFTNEERAAVEVASELKWHFPKKMIAQFRPMKRSAPATRAQDPVQPTPTPAKAQLPTTTEQQKNEADPV